MPDRRAFSLIELLVVIAIVALLVGIMIPAVNLVRTSARQDKNRANLRGLHQAIATFGNGNNGWFPGIDSAGAIERASSERTGSAVNSGAAFSSRMWVLLDGQFASPEMLINPQEERVRCQRGHPLDVREFSYAGLQIGDYANSLTTEHHAGRAGEWRNNANSEAILINCRNVGPSNTDAGVQSLFTLYPGKWTGAVVWGDNHADFAKSNTGFKTRYQARAIGGAEATEGERVSAINTNDNLFATAGSPELTEGSENPQANAMAVYN